MWPSLLPEKDLGIRKNVTSSDSIGNIELFPVKAVIHVIKPSFGKSLGSVSHVMFCFVFSFPGARLNICLKRESFPHIKLDSLPLLTK